MKTPARTPYEDILASLSQGGPSAYNVSTPTTTASPGPVPAPAPSISPEVMSYLMSKKTPGLPAAPPLDAIAPSPQPTPEPTPVVASPLPRTSSDETSMTHGPEEDLFGDLPTVDMPKLPAPAQAPEDKGHGFDPSLLGVALGGLGDAFSASAGRQGHGAEGAMNMIRSAKEEERRKVLEGRQDVEFKRNQAEQGEKDDPASVVSKQYQSLAAQYLGKKPEEFAGLSATKLGTILPVVERSYAVKENADAKRDAAKTAADARGITLGEKDSQFNQKEFDKIISDNNPNNAQSRTSIGMIGRANLNADRALTTLMKPTVTKQEAGNVMADIAGIYQGGSPTTLGMKEQEYNTVYGSLKNTLQSLTGKPQDALPDDIKARLIATLRDMKATNAAIIKRNLDTTAAAKGRILKHFPDEWKAFREQVEGGSAPADSAPTTGGANAQSGPYGPEVEKDGKTYVWSAATGKYHPK